MGDGLEVAFGLFVAVCISMFVGSLAFDIGRRSMCEEVCAPAYFDVKAGHCICLVEATK